MPEIDLAGNRVAMHTRCVLNTGHLGPLPVSTQTCSGYGTERTKRGNLEIHYRDPPRLRQDTIVLSLFAA